METFTVNPAARSSAGAYWNVPTSAIAGKEFPRLILGDHGFLARYGSALPSSEVVRRMQHAVARASLGLSGGDERCLKAARRAAAAAVSPPRLTYHTDLSLSVGGSRIHLGRCMASLLKALRDQLPQVVHDPIVGAFLLLFERYRPYDRSEVADLQIASQAWERERARISRFRPDLVTVGGDYLDFALAVGRVDIASSAFKSYRALSEEHGSRLVLTSYTGGIVLREHESDFPSGLYDGVMLPVNRDGLGMLPNGPDALSWARELNKPIIAMHALGSGRLRPTDALAYIFNEVGVAAAVVGASRYQHIDELIEACRSVLRPAGVGSRRS